MKITFTVEQKFTSKLLVF